jgi:hypothetical protein
MCASCHNKMDPLGFGLENYDGIGKWRTMDGKFPVDSSGALPNGNSFSTPGEMRTVIHDDLPTLIAQGAPAKPSRPAAEWSIARRLPCAISSSA